MVKKYTFSKKMLAVICALIMVVNAFTLPSFVQETKAQESEFSEITFGDYININPSTGLAEGGIQDGVYEVGSSTIGTVSGTHASLEGVAFNGIVKFTDDVSENPQNTCIRIGGPSQWNTWAGIGLYYEQGIVLWDYTGTTTENGGLLYRVPETEPITFKNKEAIIRLTFQTENETDVRIAFSIDGTEYYNEVIAGLAGKLGHGILVNCAGAGIELKSYLPNAEKEYTKLTFHDYGVSDNTYTTGSHVPVATDKVANLKNIAFVGEVTFSESETQKELNCIRIGGPSQWNTWAGVGVYYDNGLVLWDYTGATTANGGLLYHLVDSEEFSYKDQKVMLKLTFEYINDNQDVRLGFWVNGTRHYYRTVIGLAEKLGTGLLVNASSAPVTVASYVLQTMPSEGLKDITLEDFQIRADSVGTDGVFGTYQGDTLNGTRFTVDITMPERVGGSYLRFAGTQASGGWDGFSIKSWKDNATELELSDASGNTGYLSYCTTDVAGTKLLGEEIKLTITTEFFDADGDGKENDVMYGIYFNDVLYNNQPVVLKNHSDHVGKQILFYTDSAEHPIKLKIVKYEYYNLADGPYLVSSLSLFEGGTLTVNGTAPDWTITLPGDYSILATGNGAYEREVVLYYYGDAHPDGQMDVRDLIVLKKALNEETLPLRSSRKGADVDGNGAVNGADLRSIYDNLVGEKKIEGIKDRVISYEENVMPIAGHGGPRRTTDKNGATYDYMTDDMYRLIKDMGINLISYTVSQYHQDEAKKAEIIEGLELAEKYGLGVYVRDGRLGSKENTPNWRLSQFISVFAQYSSFKGFAVIDEPFTEYYGNYYWEKDHTAKLEDYDEISSNVNGYTNLIGYVNLNPMRESLGGEDYKDDYERYLEEYISSYDAKVLSFDCYPFDSNTTFASYFDNLAVIRENALEHKLPFWTHIQAGTNWNNNTNAEMNPTENNTPTKGEVLWNVNTSLAYGATGIQYFPLIQPPYFAYTKYSGYDYGRNGLIGANGVPNQWYYYAQEANRQIAAVDEVLMNAKSLDILAVGTAAQEDTGIQKTTYEGLNAQNAIVASNGAIVGVFDHCGKTAFYVVNYDTENAQNITLNFDGVKEYSVIAATQDTTASSDACVLSLEAGGAALVVVE